MKIKLAIAFFTASALPAAAAGPVPVVIGHGTNTCIDYTQGRLAALQVENSYFSWAQGYMSALNVTLSNQKVATHNLYRFSDDNLKKELQTYCTAHPSDLFLLAVSKTFAALPESPLP